MIGADLRQNVVNRHRTYCRFTEFSWDLRENRIVRAVVHMLSGWPFSRRLRRRLLTLDGQLGEITPVEARAADLDRIVYNRRSEDYRPIHRLCRLFLEGASLSEGAGSQRFDGFVVAMNDLFERFVTQALRRRFGPPWALHDQRRTTLDRASRIPIRPDLVLSSAGRPHVVADCKYKGLDPGPYHQADLYQMLAYATALDLRMGLLIYPRHLADVNERYRIRSPSGLGLQVSTLALDGAIAAIETGVDSLADKMRALAHAGAPEVRTTATAHPALSPV